MSQHLAAANNMPHCFGLRPPDIYVYSDTEILRFIWEANFLYVKLKTIWNGGCGIIQQKNYCLAYRNFTSMLLLNIIYIFLSVHFIVIWWDMNGKRILKSKDAFTWVPQVDQHGWINQSEPCKQFFSMEVIDGVDRWTSWRWPTFVQRRWFILGDSLQIIRINKQVTNCSPV